MSDYPAGTLWTSTLPSWQRDYYSLLLLETLRTKSILVPFTAFKQDHKAADSGVVIFTDIYDTEPNWNPLSESDIWMRGAHLDSRTVRIELEIHGDILKFSDYSEVVNYVKRGDMRGLVRNKIGQNQVDYLDLLARNAFMSHPNKTFAGGKANRGAIIAGDLFNPDIAEVIRVHLEENEIPGVVAVTDNDIQTIACVTTPRVIKDIRTGNNSKWLEVHEYAGATKKFTGEAGMWAGVRFIRTNRLRLRNHGAVTAQSTLSAAAPAGSGAALTVDAVYTVGQSNATRHITVASGLAFEPGMYITIHSQNVGSPGDPPVEGDGTQETRRIISKNGNELSLNKPLLKDHLSGDYVTNGIDIHGSLFLGGPAVVYAVGESPNVITPPKFDDLMMVNRFGWRGFLKMQQFRPEYYEVVESSGSTD